MGPLHAQVGGHLSVTEHLLASPTEHQHSPLKGSFMGFTREKATQTAQAHPDGPSSPSDTTSCHSLATGVLSPAIQTEPDSPTCRAAPVQYKLYRRRFFGLAQLAFLNIIVSWNWLTFAPVSNSSALFFGVSEASIGWFSTAFLFAFVVAVPAVIWLLNKGGPKSSVVAASLLIFTGSWMRYAGARQLDGYEGAKPPFRGAFAVVLVGQILIGLAQPFVLAAPTPYSDLWFSEKGRITATAVASLANPLGAAIGQLVIPYLVHGPTDIVAMLLVVALISTAATVPALFFPSRPPTPASHTSSLPKAALTLTSLKLLTRNASFYLLALPFATYVATFNSLSTLLNEILRPYRFTEDQAGITGALLILVGLASAAILSPLLDWRPALRLPLVKLLVPVIAGMYVGFIWAPGTRTVAAPYAIAAVLGAASFVLVPLALELLVEVTWPVPPEVSSALCWGGGQLGGGVLILIMNTMKGTGGEPEGSMKSALVFQACVACLVVPAPLCLGLWGTGRRGRQEAEREQDFAWEPFSNDDV